MEAEQDAAPPDARDVDDSEFLQDYSYAFDSTLESNPCDSPSTCLLPEVEVQRPGSAGDGDAAAVPLQRAAATSPRPRVGSTSSASSTDPPAVAISPAERDPTPTPPYQTNKRPSDQVRDDSDEDDDNMQNKRNKTHDFSHLEGSLLELFKLNANPHPKVKKELANVLSSLAGHNLEATRDYLDVWYWNQAERSKKGDEGYVTGTAQHKADSRDGSGPLSLSISAPACQSGPSSLSQPTVQPAPQPVPQPVKQSRSAQIPGTTTMTKGGTPSTRITCPKCRRSGLCRSSWVKHRDSHWGIKYGCIHCYILSQGPKYSCKLCPPARRRRSAESGVFDNLDQAIAHVLECVRNKFKKVNGNSKQWWHSNRAGHRMLLEHLEKDEKHAKLPITQRDAAFTRSWTVERQQEEKTCVDCNETFTTADKLNEHYDIEHFGMSLSPEDSGPPPPPPSDDDDDYDDEGRGHFGSPPEQYRPLPGQTGNETSRDIGPQMTTPEGPQTPAGRNRRGAGHGSSLATSTGDTQECKPTIKSQAISCDETITLSRAVHGSRRRDPNPPPDDNLRGMGSQFGDQQEPDSGRNGKLKAVVLNHLGKGATGVVYAVWVPSSLNGELARKTIRLPIDDTPRVAVLAQIRREIKMLRLLRHRHIIRLVGHHKDDGDELQLLMDPAADGDLMTFLTKRADEKTLSGVARREGKVLDQVTRWMSCLSSALVYMHSAGVTHGDIKPHNILISGNRVCFADFGTAEFEFEVFGNINPNSRWTTPVYCAPEVSQSSSMRGQISRAADIWSFGCVLLEVATWLLEYPPQAARESGGLGTRRRPYHADLEKVLHRVRGLRRRFEPAEQLRGRISILDAVLGMLVLEPELRLTSREVWTLLAQPSAAEESVTSRMSHGGTEYPCSCDGEPLPTVTEIRQKALEAVPSGVVATPEETESAVLFAMGGWISDTGDRLPTLAGGESRPGHVDDVGAQLEWTDELMI